MNKTARSLICMLTGLVISQTVYAKELTVAVRALQGVEKAVQQWQATIDTLTENIPEHSFKLKPIISLNEITSAAGAGEIDFILSNPSSYVEANVLHGARALATLNNRRADTAQTRFGSVIFTHVRNDHILKLKDLKGATVMAVSEPAFGGWRVAWLEMLEQGLNPYKDLKGLMFTESRTQPEVINAVLEGKADVGVVRTDQLERMAESGNIDLRYFRILNSKNTEGFPFFHSTPLYPEWPFAAMPSVSEPLMERVKQVLLSISKDSAAATEGNYIGWVIAHDYSPVVVLMKRLKVGPYAK